MCRAILTLRGPVSCHSEERSVRWASRAASSASGAVGKAQQKSSPTVLKTYPPCSCVAFLKIASWRERAPCMGCGCLSHLFVEPSMSVNRKVTVPVGGLGTTLMSSLLPLRGHYSSGAFLGSSVHPSGWRRLLNLMTITLAAER